MARSPAARQHPRSVRRRLAAAAVAAALSAAAAVCLAATAAVGGSPPSPPAPPTSALRADSPPPIRREPPPFLRPAEIAELPPLARIFVDPTLPTRLLAEAVDGSSCALTDFWLAAAPVPSDIVAGQSSQFAVAVLGTQVCTCELPLGARFPSSICARVRAAREEPACFPAAASVALAGGHEVRVGALGLGDRLARGVGGGGGAQSSPLLGWSHHDAAAVTRFVVVAYELAGDAPSVNATADEARRPASPRGLNRRTLRASPGHYLYTAAGSLIPAADVAVGDSLAAADGSPALVVAVSTALDVGLYNPHPAAGELIVDGLRVSAYTTAVPPPIAHAALAPVRVAAAAGVVDPLGRVWPAVTGVRRLVVGVGAWLAAVGGGDSVVAAGMVGGEL